jgi:hypothetical protein
VREFNLFILADTRPLTRSNRGNQFDGSHNRAGAFPKLGALGRYAKNSYPRIVLVRPERLVVDRPDLLDPISIVDDLGMTGNRNIFLAFGVC